MAARTSLLPESANLNSAAVGAITLLSDRTRHRDAMCHCFGSIDELTEREREELVEEHSVEELRAEHSEEELARLGVAD